MSVSTKIEQLNWTLISLIIALALIGFAMLYSAGNGNYHPWMMRQMLFFAIFLPVMIAIAVIDITVWFNFAYISYGIALILVIIVDVMGHNAMGATRWFRLGPITIQPSEIMKVCTIFALSRYFYNTEAQNITKIRYTIIPILLIVIPVVFIFHQPDLGTALILIISSVTILFLAGIYLRYFITAGILLLLSIPFVWNFVLYDYQKQRVLTFLNPGSDPLGSGYNIIQSKIAIGSGGFIGKGYLNGTQGQLNFLPEKQTDFIFTMLAEELGFLGGFFTIALCCAIVAVCVHIASNIKHQYGRLLTIGIANLFFIHMIINIGMGMGLLPVVGAPLPMVSYGGTIMASMMIGFGLVLNADLYKNSYPER